MSNNDPNYIDKRLKEQKTVVVIPNSDLVLVENRNETEMTKENRIKTFWCNPFSP